MKWDQGLRAIITVLMVSLVVAALANCAPTQRASKEETEPIEPSSSDQQQAKQDTNFDPGQKLEIKQEKQQKSSDRKQEKNENKKQEASQSNNLNVGDTAKLKDGRIRVYQYYPQVQSQNQFMQPKAGMEFGAINVEGCANNDAQSFSLNPFFFNIQMPDNTRREAAFPVAEPPLNHTDLAPGECVRGWVTFEVPQGQKPNAIYFKPMGGESARWNI
jgi:hypothetical protein